MKKNEMLDTQLDTDEAPIKNEVQLHKSNGGLQITTVDPRNIDLLDEAEKAPFDIVGTYWTPESIGESKRVIFDRIDVSKVADMNNEDKTIELECAHFFVKEDGMTKMILNGSKRLVGALGNIAKGTPLEIKYLGKRTNNTNSFKSDNWSVTPLIVKQKPVEEVEEVEEDLPF